MEDRFDDLKDYLELVQDRVQKDVKKWKSKDEFKIRKNTLILGGAVLFLGGVVVGILTASKHCFASGNNKCNISYDCGCNCKDEESCCHGDGCCK